MRMILTPLLAALTLGAAAAEERRLGPETNLPLPRFVSLNTDKANVRRGPGLSHRIDWVFLRRGMPLQVVAEHGRWRRVRDQDDTGGWVHHALLRGARSAVITAAPNAPLHAEPSRDAPVVALAESGAVARLEECSAAWCRIEADGVDGWAEKSAIWGVDADEEFD